LKANSQHEWKSAIADAVDELSLLKFFPADPAARRAIMRLLSRLIEPGRLDQLTWLVQTMIDRVGTWNGPVELRGVYATRYKPADGIEASCAVTPGFTPDEMETRAKASELPQAEARRLHGIGVAAHQIDIKSLAAGDRQ
jgi:hypothetical protein